MRPLAAAALVALLTGCGSGARSLPPSAPISDSSRADVTLTIAVPRATNAALERIRPLYIASTTASVSFTVKTLGGQVVLSQTFGVTATSNGCTTSESETTCTENLVFAPGSYTASISTYDSSAKVLSEAQQVSFTAQTGVANSISFTLYGVPHAITVTGGADSIRGSQAAGFTVYGTQAQSFTIAATDADGNTIVGPGSPTWSVAEESGSSLYRTRRKAPSFRAGI